jgi:glycosyltransferase involved in cell wall biosynthesis
VKILITAVQFSSSLSGISRYAFNVVRCLLSQPDIAEVHIVLSPWQRELAWASGLQDMDRVTVHIAGMEQSALSRNLWYYRHLPKLIAEIQPDTLHLSYPVPINASAIGCPIAVTLHDLYPYELPENFGFPKVIFNRLILSQCLRRADAIACVSDTTLFRMQQYTPWVTSGKALRIYNCVEPETACASLPPIAGWRGEPFLLSVSQHRRNKNIPLIVRAFHRLLHEGSIDPEMKLLIVGITGPETSHIHRLVSTLRLDGQVIFLNGIPEASLQWCYKQCEMLIAPSETEGFGLPVAEALLAGCRVVCSDIPVFHEIDEDHCRFVTLGPCAEERLAHAIVSSLGQPPPRPLSLPRFSAKVLGVQYARLYRGLIADADLRRVQHSIGPQRSSPEGYTS